MCDRHLHPRQTSIVLRVPSAHMSIDSAIDTVREAVEVKRRSGGRMLGRALNDLGNAYVAGGDVSSTIDTVREGVDDVNYVNSTRFEIVIFGTIILHTLKNSMKQKKSLVYTKDFVTSLKGS